MQNASIRIATTEDIPAIRHVASEAWPVAFKDIISEEQLHFDLNREYADDALFGQMAQGHTFLLLVTEPETQVVGFASISTSPDHADRLTLHKLYLLPELKGKGHGATLMDAVIREAQTRGLASVELKVNRQNPAVAFYVRQGFRIERSVDIPIGNGFWRYDYVMIKTL